MTPASDVLRLIETVDPVDTAKLDEIDARVWCWLSDCDFGGGDFDNGITFKAIPQRGAPAFFKSLPPWEKYTRSRDALKAIRPEGFFPNISRSPKGNYCCSSSFYDFEAPFLPTEEIAELHAIIQAIEYERLATNP
jgi:hypothetical protein